MDPGIGEVAWSNLKKNKAFNVKVPAEAFSVFEPIVIGFPSHAGDELFSQKADLSAIVNIKMVFLKYALDKNFIEDYMAAIGLGNELFGMVSATLGGLVDTFQEIIGDIPAFLKMQGVSEDQALKMLGLDKKTIKRTKNGMTITELYKEFPLVIVENDE